MSLVSLISGRERDSSYVEELLRPLSPKPSDYVLEAPFGTSCRVPRLSGGLGPAIVSRAFSEAMRLEVARASGTGSKLLERLEGKDGYRSLSLLRPGVAKAIEPEYRDSLERYRLYVGGRMELGEVMPAALIMGKLSLVSSRGYFDGEAKDLVGVPDPRATDELLALSRLFQEFLKLKFPAKIPDGIVYTPCFGSLSRGMGGASADIYLNSYFTDSSVASSTMGLSRFSKKAAALLVLPEAFKILRGSKTRGWKGAALYMARMGAMYYLDAGSFLNTRRAEMIRAERGMIRRFVGRQIEV